MKLYAYVDGNQREGEFSLSFTSNQMFDARVVLALSADKIDGFGPVKIGLTRAEALLVIQKLSASLLNDAREEIQ